MKEITVSDIMIGGSNKLVLIAGPCVIESEAMVLETVDNLMMITDRLKIPFIFDPGQQCTSMDGDELKRGLVGSKFVICNDYEFGLIQQKTSLKESDLLQKSGGLVVTRGEQGALIQTQQERYEGAAVKPNRNVDPTGIGDAYRGGLLKGIAKGLDLRTSAQIGSVAATYVLEELGGMSHKYSLDEFRNRYEKQFGSSPF